MNGYKITLISLLAAAKLFSQTDQYHFVHFENIFQEGIYITFKDFKNQTPVKKSSIIALEDPRQTNFTFKVLAYEQFSFFDTLGNKITINSDEIWGVVRRNSLYILHDRMLSKVQINGRWGYFNTYQTNHSPALAMFPSNHYAVQVPVNSGRRGTTMTIDLKNGKINELKRKKLMDIMQIDSNLLKEYKSLSRRKQKKLKYLYLRKLNDQVKFHLPGQ